MKSTSSLPPPMSPTSSFITSSSSRMSSSSTSAPSYASMSSSTASASQQFLTAVCWNALTVPPYEIKKSCSSSSSPSFASTMDATSLKMQQQQQKQQQQKKTASDSFVTPRVTQKKGFPTGSAASTSSSMTSSTLCQTVSLPEATSSTTLSSPPPTTITNKATLSCSEAPTARLNAAYSKSASGSIQTKNFVNKVNDVDDVNNVNKVFPSLSSACATLRIMRHQTLPTSVIASSGSSTASSAAATVSKNSSSIVCLSTPSSMSSPVNASSSSLRTKSSSSSSSSSSFSFSFSFSFSSPSFSSSFSVLFRRIFSVFIAITLLSASKSLAAHTGCHDVKLSASSLGISRHDVPSAPIVGERLQFCNSFVNSSRSGSSGSSSSGEGSCCTAGMEHKLSTKCLVDYESSLRGSTTQLRKLFTAETQRFDDFFNRLLENGEKDLNKMFLRTYGALYEQNAGVFKALFVDLKAFFLGRNVDLGDVLNHFFGELLKKMFQLINAQYQFDDSYLSCVTELMEELKPFKDVPQRLTLQIKRSFTAARSFVQALAVARDVIHRSAEIQPSSDCHNALMRMRFCPHCQGLSKNVKPCNSLCLNVMKGCLSQQSELDATWNKFTDALSLLADRLEGPFNIEQVVDPIDVKISDAIMNFQEASAEVSKRVFTQCGQPDFNHNRKRRSSSSSPSSSPSSQTKRSLTFPGGVNFDDVIIDDSGDALGGVGVPVSFPDAPDATGNGGGGQRSGAKSADGSVIEMNYERGDGGGGSNNFRFSGNPNENSGFNSNSLPDSDSLDFLVRELKSKVKVSRSIWAHLPQTVCNDETMSDAAAAAATGSGGSSSSSSSCWNGKEQGAYDAPVVEENGLKATLKNPEFPSSGDPSFNEATLKPHSVIQEQLTALKSMTQRLKDAYNGMDVKWPEKGPRISSGPRRGGGAGKMSLQGSGSGDVTDIDDEIDDTMDDGDDVDNDLEGSGSGGFDSGFQPSVDQSTSGGSSKPGWIEPNRGGGGGGGGGGSGSSVGFDGSVNQPKDKKEEKTNYVKSPKCEGKLIGKYCVVEGASAGSGATRSVVTSSCVVTLIGIAAAFTSWRHIAL